MLELMKGNLLDAPVQALVNTVNTVGVMGKGIALQFKQAFPDNFKVYEAACKRHEVVPGKMLVVPTHRFDNPKCIVNFPTKRHWKGKSRIEDIEIGLSDLVDVIRRENIRSIAVPPLGCGNGGLEWSTVRPKIEKALGQVPDVRVLLYAPEAAPAVDDMRVATQKPPMNDNRAALVAMMMNYGEIGYRLTLLEIQKLAYFLQLAGQPLKLRFMKQKYGPYAEALNHVLQRLEGHFVRGYGDRSREASIQVLPEGRKDVAAYLADDETTLKRIEAVNELIEGFETPHGMELLATVHWVMAENPQARTDVEKAIQDVHAWNDRKARVFPKHHIQVAYDQLRRLKWA
ncbi:MAG TPA: macro domain-containing protein [Edaphobacter sp.]|nr:macro domain-containing protein [Edaphobacter sp.]